MQGSAPVRILTRPRNNAHSSRANAGNVRPAQAQLSGSSAQTDRTGLAPEHSGAVPDVVEAAAEPAGTSILGHLVQDATLSVASGVAQVSADDIRPQFICGLLCLEHL